MNHEWLAPILQRAIDRGAEINASVIASRFCAPVWRGDPRIEVRRPRAWPEYRVETARQKLDILLAPLLPTPANLARSNTKRIDAARSGAALLVSEAGIYQPSGEEAALGMVVPLHPAAWEGAIVALANDPERRMRLAQLNYEHVTARRENCRTAFTRVADHV